MNTLPTAIQDSAKHPNSEWARYERDILAACAVLGEAGLAAALAEGGALPVEEAVAYALGEGPLPALRS